MSTTCTLVNAVNHGSVIQLVFCPVEQNGLPPIVVTGDHRPINHFLADWDAAGRPPVDVADDHETLLLA